MLTTFRLGAAAAGFNCLRPRRTLLRAHYFECNPRCAAMAAGEDVCLRCPACALRLQRTRRAVCLKCTGTPAARIKLEIRLATFAEVSQYRPSKGCTGVKACHQSHIPRRLSASCAHHFRAHLPKRRRNDRESPRDRASFTPSPFFMLLCVRSPSAPRARLVRLREHVPMPGCVKAPLCPMPQGLSMLRAASQVLKPREFVRKMHCALLPKSEVRAAVV